MKAEWTNKDSLSIESTGQKAILVIDMPSNCFGCPCYYDSFYCKDMDREYINATDRPSWCRLKPMPEKKQPKDPDETWDEMMQRFGYNECIEEIENESNSNH